MFNTCSTKNRNKNTTSLSTGEVHLSTSSVSNGGMSVDCRMAVLIHCMAKSSGKLVNSGFTSHDSSLFSCGICTVLTALIKSFVDRNLRLDF